MSKIHNFSAGPAILPQEVLVQAAAACTDFYKGLSILEISHRDQSFVDVMEEARSRVKQLMGLGNDYTALFLQGGASLQFAMVPMNLLKTNAAYLNTGTWATAAIKDAKIYGDVAVVASSENTNFNYIPKNVVVSDKADYFHITTNNTIFGTRITDLPNIPQNVPLVARDVGFFGHEHKFFFQFGIFHHESDVHRRAVYRVGNDCFEQWIAIYLLVQKRCFGVVACFYSRQTTYLFYPTQYQHRAIDRKHGRRVVHRFAFDLNLIVEHFG